MDSDLSSTSRYFGRWLLLPVVAAPLVVWAVALPGCAEPCVDDGLFQKYCPVADTEVGTGDELTGDGDGDGDTAEAGDGDGDGDTAEAGETEGCAVLDVILIPQTPTLVLLVDQSGSMTASFGDDTRWNVITEVLVDPINGVVAQYEASIRFGLALYTSTGGTAGGECPMLDEVAPVLNNFTDIAATMNAADPIGDTPTGESLEIVAQKLAALNVPGRKYIVLATDGEPDSCAVPNPQTAQPEAVAAAEAAFALGIETFVISVGNDVSDGHLQDMANAGQGIGPGDQNAAFYKALEEDALVTAFDTILASVRPCELDLMTALSAQDALGCTIEVNGNTVGFNDENGWRLNGPNEVELLGTACTALQQGTSSVQMECACGLL